jgi:hypothetical protein
MLAEPAAMGRGDGPPSRSRRHSIVKVVTS